MNKDEAIQIIRSNYPTGRNQLCEALETLIPELKESEDERIRKALIHLISEQDGYLTAITGISVINILAWLEKQCHTDSIIEKAKTEKQRVIITETDGNANIDWDTRSLEDARSLLEYGLQYINTELEKHGEQNHADKIEPNFNVGDWITDGTSTFQIVKIENEYYVADDRDRVWINTINQYYHLWTIRDAKDGDVLANGNIVLIFKYFEEPSYRQHIIAHIGLDLFGQIQVTNRHWNLGLNGAKPATKEQRYLLFQKMKEAGYEWDTEKKELKKIEPKPAWSEEDENLYNRCMSAIQTRYNDGLFSKKEYRQISQWLQSIKERYTWKPSDEQIEALLKLEEMHVLEHEKNQENAHLYMVVKSIREQLLKLKGE